MMSVILAFIVAFESSIPFT